MNPLYARIEYETNFTFYQDPPEIPEEQEVGRSGTSNGIRA